MLRLSRITRLSLSAGSLSVTLIFARWGLHTKLQRFLLAFLPQSDGRYLISTSYCSLHYYKVCKEIEILVYGRGQER